MWDALTGDELYSFEHKHIVRTCAFSEVCFLVLLPQLHCLLDTYHKYSLRKLPAFINFNLVLHVLHTNCRISACLIGQ